MRCFACGDDTVEVHESKDFKGLMICYECEKTHDKDTLKFIAATTRTPFKINHRD